MQPGRTAHLKHSAVAWAIVALFLLPACGKSIGDDCGSNVDCSPDGDRVCDLASPGGYCTIEGCDHDTCPDDAVCIRFYPAEFLTVPCDPNTEDVPQSALPQDVRTTNHCLAQQRCLSSGRCAPRASERRYCMKPCSGDGDCRSDYVCRRTGVLGAEVVPPTGEASAEPARFCSGAATR
jgi:hypothetical protein